METIAQEAKRLLSISQKKNSKFDFKFRLYRDDMNAWLLSQIQVIFISGLPIVSKQTKMGGLCFHEKSQKKFGYSVKVRGRYFNTAGSHSYPIISFKGEYIDFIVKDFPRYPAFYADSHAARNLLGGYRTDMFGISGQGLYPTWMQYRKFEIIPIRPTT